MLGTTVNLDSDGSTMLALTVLDQPVYEIHALDAIPIVLAVYPCQNRISVEMDEQLEYLEKPKRNLRFRWLRYLLLVLICSFPLWVCPSVYGFYELKDALDRRYVESLMPTYPNAQRVYEDFGFGTANSGEQYLYFWTQDSSETVRSYLEQQYRISFTEMDSYALFGAHLALEDFPTYERNYSCIYRCVTAILIPQDTDAEVYLPAIETLRAHYLHRVSLDRSKPEPTPHPTKFRGGTLLIYTYDTPEM